MEIPHYHYKDIAENYTLWSKGNVELSQKNKLPLTKNIKIYEKDLRYFYPNVTHFHEADFNAYQKLQRSEKSKYEELCLMYTILLME